MNILSDDICTYIAGFLSITDLGAVIQSKLNKAIQIELIRKKEKALYLVRWWKQNRVPHVNDIFGYKIIMFGYSQVFNGSIRDY